MLRKEKPEKKSGLHGIRSLYLCDTSAALYQLSQLGAGHWVGSFINPWKDDDEVLNIRKSYMWTAEWRIKWRMIFKIKLVEKLKLD